MSSDGDTFVRPQIGLELEQSLMASADSRELRDAAVMAGLASGPSASAGTVERPSCSGSKRKSKVGAFRRLASHFSPQSNCFGQFLPLLPPAEGSMRVLQARKPYTITKQREKWTDQEHLRFLEALRLYGRAWRRIEGAHPPRPPFECLQLCGPQAFWRNAEVFLVICRAHRVQNSRASPESCSKVFLQIGEAGGSWHKARRWASARREIYLLSPKYLKGQ